MLEEISHKLSGATVFFFKIRCQGQILVSTPGYTLIILNYIQNSQRLIQISLHAIWTQDITGCVPNVHGSDNRQTTRYHSNTG